MTSRRRLRRAAVQIAANRNERPASPLAALRKLVVQERRDWQQPGAPRIGWKRGELFEVLEPLLQLDLAAALQEWGDCGYYIAQSWGWLWVLYALITPRRVIHGAVTKFEGRAERGK